MLCRVKVTGAGVVAYEGEDGLEHPVPRGEYTLTKSDGRYTLTGAYSWRWAEELEELGVTPRSVSGDYLIIAPDGIGAGGYLDQKLEDRTLQIIEGVRP